jgi:hypothetical protein
VPKASSEHDKGVASEKFQRLGSQWRGWRQNRIGWLAGGELIGLWMRPADAHGSDVNRRGTSSARSF